MDSVEVQEKENKVDVLCSRPPENVKLGSFTSLSCSAAKKRTKKREDFLPFSLPSPSSLLKLPDIIVLELPWTQRIAGNAF